MTWEVVIIAVLASVICCSLSPLCSLVFRSCLAACTSAAAGSDPRSGPTYRHELSANRRPGRRIPFRQLSSGTESRSLAWAGGQPPFTWPVGPAVCARRSDRAGYRRHDRASSRQTDPSQRHLPRSGAQLALAFCESQRLALGQFDAAGSGTLGRSHVGLTVPDVSRAE